MAAPTFTPYTWLRINGNGPLPPPSLPIGPNSPYFRFLPQSNVVGPNSPWPQRALPAGRPGSGLASTIQQGAQRTLPVGETALPSGVAPRTASAGVARDLVQRALTPAGPVDDVATAALNAGPRVFPMGPAAPAASGVASQVGVNAALAGPPAATGAPMFVQGAATGATSAAESAAARGGLMATARGALSSLKPVGMRGMGLAIIPGIAGSVGGNMLDESNALGGSESKLNDSVSKMLKWGGFGAGLGMAAGPVGAALGGAGGAVVGLIHEGLERQGVLGSETKQEQFNTTLNDTENAVREIGLPQEVINEYRRQLDAGLQFAKDDSEKLTLAQTYAESLQAEAMNFAKDPSQYANASPEAQAEAQLANDLIMRSVMVNAVKPYADNFLSRSQAEAQSYRNMAQGAGGALAPMYEQMAANTEQQGARHAMEIMQSVEVTPYQMAAERQAQYLNQMSNQLVQQAMSQVMSGQQGGQAGSQDLTALIDQYASAAQPQ